MKDDEKNIRNMRVGFRLEKKGKKRKKKEMIRKKTTKYFEKKR